MNSPTIFTGAPAVNANATLKSLVLVSLALATMLLTACATSKAPPVGAGDPYPPPINDPQIAVLPQELRPWLAFHPATIVDDGQRPLHVQVPMRNLTERQLLLEYRVLFYEASGIEMEPKMGWKMIALNPKQTVRLDGRALSADAVTYKVEVRWSR